MRHRAKFIKIGPTVADICQFNIFFGFLKCKFLTVRAVIDRQQRAAGLLLSAPQAGDVDR